MPACRISGATTSLGSQSIGYAGRISVNGALLADPSRLVVYQAGVAAGDATRPNFIYDQLMEASLEFAPGSGIGALSRLTRARSVRSCAR